MIVYDKLKIKMKEVDLNWAGLSAITGINHKACSNMSTGKYVSLETIERLCAFFNCQPNDIIEYITEDELKKRQIRALKAQIAELEGK